MELHVVGPSLNDKPMYSSVCEVLDFQLLVDVSVVDEKLEQVNDVINSFNLELQQYKQTIQRISKRDIITFIGII